MKIVVTTYPFKEDNKYIPELTKLGYEITFNPYKRKMSPEEHRDFLIKENPEFIIAGTEMYTPEVLDLCKDLKFISRVGIGMDSVDIDACNERGISVNNTPDAPSVAVAELTIGQIINACRKIQLVDSDMRDSVWNRHIGKSIQGSRVGVIGCGRIGKGVINRLLPFNPSLLYAHDIDMDKTFFPGQNVLVSSKQEILEDCDIITIHIPFDEHNEGYISKKELSIIKKDAIIINTSRGGIINEGDLYNWLVENKSASAVVDTFEKEPYDGDLNKLSNCFVTPHLGSCTINSRKDMEEGSVNNVLKHLNEGSL